MHYTHSSAGYLLAGQVHILCAKTRNLQAAFQTCIHHRTRSTGNNIYTIFWRTQISCPINSLFFQEYFKISPLQVSLYRLPSFRRVSPAVPHARSSRAPAKKTQRTTSTAVWDNLKRRAEHSSGSLGERNDVLKKEKGTSTAVRICRLPRTSSIPQKIHHFHRAPKLLDKKKITHGNIEYRTEDGNPSPSRCRCS